MALFSFQGDKPCIGMCYYQKVLALKNKIDRENAENEVIEVSNIKMAPQIKILPTLCL